MSVQSFATPDDLRAWFDEHAGERAELHLGFWKKGTGRPSVTWPEAVDEALCVGWIDGVRRRLDDESYAIRFTPRTQGSTWSAVNVARMAVLEAEGRVREPGRAAFAARREDRTATYAYERREEAALPVEQQARFEAVPDAWAFFTAQAPSYRRTAVHWVVSAKREQTRERRFAQLVADSAAGRRLAQLA